jgi:serine/threonine protein kinase
VACLGDVDGDSTQDLAVGARYDGDGGFERGAVYVVFLYPNGTVKAEQKISDTEGNFQGRLAYAFEFGFAVSGMGDVDGDATRDLAVGAIRDDDGELRRGAVHVLFLGQVGVVPCSLTTLGRECDDLDFCSSASTCTDVSGVPTCLADDVCNIPPGTPEFTIKIAINCSTFDGDEFKKVLFEKSFIPPSTLHYTAAVQCLADPCFANGVIVVNFILVDVDGVTWKEGSAVFDYVNQTLAGSTAGGTTGASSTLGTTDSSSTASGSSCGTLPTGKFPVFTVVIAPKPNDPVLSTTAAAIELDDSTDGDCWATGNACLPALLGIIAAFCFVVLVVLAVFVSRRKRRGAESVELSELSGDESQREVSLGNLKLLQDVKKTRNVNKSAGLYEGMWQGTTKVALKRVLARDDPSRLESLEGHLLAAVRHPNCVSFYGLHQEDAKGEFLDVRRSFFLVTEYFELGSMAAVLRSRPAEAESVLVLSSACAQVAAGMAYLKDELNVVHRSLSLETIMATASMTAEHVGYTCKVAEYGLVRVLHPELDAIYGHAEEEVTSVRYFAPEALLRERYSEASDVYSFGWLCYEILSMGKPARDDLSNAEVVSAAQEAAGEKRESSEPSPFEAGLWVLEDEFPEDIWQTIRACLHANPAKRPTFRSLADDLSAAHQRLMDVGGGNPKSHLLSGIQSAGQSAGQSATSGADTHYTGIVDGVSVPSHYTGIVEDDAVPSHYTGIVDGDAVPSHYGGIEEDTAVPSHYEGIAEDDAVPSHYGGIEDLPEDVSRRSSMVSFSSSSSVSTLSEDDE